MLWIFCLFNVLIWLPVREVRAELGPKVEMAIDAHLKLRLHSTLLRTQTQLDLKLEHLRSLNLPEEEFLEAWSREFRVITKNYIQEQMENHSFDARQINVVRRQLSKLNWKEFGSYFLKQVAHLKAFTRLSGMGLFMAVALSNILQVVLPFVLAAVGYSPMWAIILLKIPTTLPIIYAYQLGDDLLYRMKLTEALGGSQAYQDYKTLQRTTLKELNLKHIQDHILALDQSGEAVIISRPNPLTQLSQMFGLRKDHLTIKALKTFMSENGIDDQLAWGLANDTKLNSQDRIAMIMTHFHETLEAEQKAALRLQFSDSFTIAAKDVENWREISGWVNRTLRSRTSQDLYYNLERMPDELRPQELSAIWEEILLPELSKNGQLNYSQMRRSVRRFHSYKLEVEKLDHKTMTPQMRQKFFDYFSDSLQTKTQGCFKTHQQVIELLLKSL